MVKKQFIDPDLRFIPIEGSVLTQTPGMASEGAESDQDPEAPARGKTPLPTSVNQVLSQTADQK